MTTLFFICLAVGAGFVIISTLLGSVAGAIDADLSVGSAVSPFKPIVIALFLTVFGGLGLILTPSLGTWMSIPISIFGGLVLSYILFRFVMVPLHKWQNTSAHDKQSIIGVTARVAEHIPQGGYGKISYTYDNKILSGPAKSEDGNEIKRNTEVEIVYIERNTYHVRVKV